MATTSAGTTTTTTTTTTSAERSATSPPASGLTFTRLIPSLPIGVLNSINPFASSDASTTTPNGKVGSREASPAPGDPNAAFFKRPLFGAILSRPAALIGGGTAPNPAAPSTTLSPEDDGVASAHLRHGSTVMFAEPSASDSDDGSREGEKRQKRSRNKPKTSYSICHPAPASLARHKLHRRPRSLLQLHRLSANNRPVPAFEVIPSANFSAKLTKSIIKTYKTRHGLCYNDLVVLRAEKYYTEEHEEEQDSRDIVALVCRGRNSSISDSLPMGGKAKICMSNGEEWEAYPHGTSGYEFFTTDAHGLGITVRWVQKKTRDAKPGHKKFNFSTIAQNTRKHPVIATLSDTGLDIFDTYKVPDPAVPTPLSTPVHQDSFLAQAMEDEDAPTGHDECVTDERLRSIITVTAIYVAFKEGWSPYFKYDDKDASSKLSISPQKDALSTPLDTPPGSPLVKALEKRGSIRSVGSGLMRRSSVLSKSNRDSTLSVDSVASNDTASTPRVGRTRADSASTVLVHRATSNRRRTNQQATWRPDLLSVQNTVPEASREDLTRVKSSRRSSAKVVASPSSTRKSSTRKAPMTVDPEDSDEDEDEDDGEEEVSPTRKPREDKRGSSVPSDTTTSEQPAQKPAPLSTTKRSATAGKGSGWKRLFCIG